MTIGKMPFWELNLMSKKNPVHTAGFLTGYDERNFTQDEIVARESGQNAGDAGRNVSGNTELIFQKLNIQGKNKEKFLKIFQFEELLEPRLDSFKLKEKNQSICDNLEKFFHDDDLSLLLIRDFNTCGLGGKLDRYEKEDHFSRLVCALNLDDKADTDHDSGGSYGLGKTVYAKNSAINTVIFHSVFDESDATNGANRRLMAAGIYPKHSYDGKDYGGYAYFGERVDIEKNDVKPFENETAEEIWTQIQACVSADISRPKSQTGTDVLILMDTLDIDNIKTAVEDYYFPAIINGDLSVRFIDENENQDFPKPLERKDLDQFIKLMKTAESSKDITEDERIVKNLHKFNNLKLGRIAYAASEPDEASSDRNNCVAVVRGTGMVMDYFKLGTDQYEPAVGVFVADSDIYKFLIESENPAHSEWSKHASRLDRRYPIEGKKIVSRVNNAIKSRFIEFQRNLQPDIITKRGESGLLSRILSGALTGGSTGDSPVPDKDFDNPVAMHLTRNQRQDDSSVWSLRIHDNEHTPEKSFQLKLYPSISLVGDSRRVSIKHMNFMVRDHQGKVLANESKPELIYNFERGDILDLIVEFSNPGSRNYIVECKCVAENETQEW
jgi:flagellar biosynthesis regulator FlbT